MFGLLKEQMLPCLSLVSDVFILYFCNKLLRLNNWFKTGDRESAFISSHNSTQFSPFVDVNFHCGDKYKNVHALLQFSQNGNYLRTKLLWFAQISRHWKNLGQDLKSKQRLHFHSSGPWKRETRQWRWSYTDNIHRVAICEWVTVLF